MTVRENLLAGAYTRTDKAGVAEDLERMYERFPRLAERSRRAQCRAANSRCSRSRVR